MGGSGIILVVLIGNYYNAEGLGIYSQAFAIYMILSVVSTFGINNSVVKYSAEFKDEINIINELITSALVLVFILSFTLSLTAFFITNLNLELLNKKEVSSALKVLLIGLPFFSLNKVLMGFLNGLREMKSFAFTQSSRWIVVLLIASISVFKQKSLYFILAAFPFTEILLFIGLLIYCKKSFSFDFSNLKKWNKKHLLFGSKTIFSRSIRELRTRIDILMIGFFLSDFHVGLYSFAATIVNGLLMVSSVVQLAFNPIISELTSKNQIDQLKKHIAKIKKVTFLCMTPLILIVGIVYPFFVNFFMQNKEIYIGNIQTFYILLVGVGFLSMFSWSGGILAMSGYPGKQVWLNLITFLFNIAANVVLIPILGISGAAIATSLSYFLMIFMLNYLIKQTLNVSLMRIR